MGIYKFYNYYCNNIKLFVQLHHITIPTGLSTPKKRKLCSSPGNYLQQDFLLILPENPTCRHLFYQMPGILHWSRPGKAAARGNLPRNRDQPSWHSLFFTKTLCCHRLRRRVERNYQSQFFLSHAIILSQSRIPVQLLLLSQFFPYFSQIFLHLSWSAPL